MLAETTDRKVNSKAHGINREPKSAIISFAGSSPSDKSAQSTSKPVVDLDVKAERLKNVKEQPASQLSAAKRQPSDLFKSFSGPGRSSKHENTSSSTVASLAPNTAIRVSSFSSSNCRISNRAYQDSKSVPEDSKSNLGISRLLLILLRRNNERCF